MVSLSTYVCEALISNLIPVSSHGMELLSLTVSNNSQCKVCISVLYRPPSSSATFFEDLFLYLQSIDITHFSNYFVITLILLIVDCVTFLLPLVSHRQFPSLPTIALMVLISC